MFHSADSSRSVSFLDFSLVNREIDEDRLLIRLNKIYA